MVQIKKKTVLITGAARRIGREIALDLAGHGWSVAVHYLRSKEAAVDLVNTINRRGGRAIALQADLARESEVEQLIPDAVERLGFLSCLINNASVFENDDAATTTRESWDRHIECNLRAPLVLSQAFARQMPEGAHGNIINLLDQRVLKLTPAFLSYTVSKSALWTLTRTLAMALAPQIRVNGIGPGPTLRNERQSESHFDNQWKSLPLQRRVMPQEICDAVRYLIAAPSMTGQMIALDAGEHLGWAQPNWGFIPVE